MDPLKKVYGKKKKKKDRGTSSGLGEATEPTPAKKRTKTQIETISTPTVQATKDPVIDQPQVNPQPSIAEPTHPIEPQPETATETIIQIVEQLNEGEDVEDEGTGNEEGIGEEQETEKEGDDEPYDDFKFYNNRAEGNFGKCWCKRSVIVERGMNLSHFQTEEFGLKQNFERRRWTKWAQFNGVAVVPIVQEFYANIVKTENEGKDCLVTKVRGVHFKIYPKDVRKFFGVKEEKQPQFPFSEDDALDRDSLAKILTGKENAEWGHKNKLAKNRLTPKFNSLHFLACSQLNPVLNTSELSYERGLLLYAIDAGLRIELGHIIWKHIADVSKIRKGVTGLPFGGFITKYVCKRKVIVELGEQVAKPLGPITASSRERSASHKKAKENTTTEEFMENMHNKWDEVNVKLGEVKETQYFIKQELQNQGKRIAAMEEKLELLVRAVGVGTSSRPFDDPPLDT